MHTHRSHGSVAPTPAQPLIDPRTAGSARSLIWLQRAAGNDAVQRLLGDETTVQRYRKRGAMNFGAADSGTLVEQSFKGKSKQPWISNVAVVFDSVVPDAFGVDMPRGTATATYFANKHALASFAVTVSGGPRGLRSDPGSFVVHRIEGVGYNDASAAAAIAAIDPSSLEGPKRGRHRRYTKPGPGQKPVDVNASMHLAVFYHKGEALHFSTPNTASHGCVHVDGWDQLTQLNYHSVIGRTRVHVTYTGPAKTRFAP